MNNQSPSPDAANTSDTNGRYPFQTVDRHNPEIIYHLMDRQATLDRVRTFNQLDVYLRNRGPCVELLTQDVEYFEEQAEIRETQDPQDIPRYQGESDNAAHHEPNPWSGEEDEFYGPSGEQEPRYPLEIEQPEPAAPEVSEPRPVLEESEISEEDSGLEEDEVRTETVPEVGEVDGKAVSADSESLESSELEEGEIRESPRPVQEDAPVPPSMTTKASAPPPTLCSLLRDAHVNYTALLSRLRNRTSTSLSRDTGGILQRDYFHGVSALCPAAYIVRHMRSADEGLGSIFDPDFDTVRAEALDDWDIAMPEPEWVINRRDYQLPGVADGARVTKIVLPHIYFPGWRGTPAVDVLKSNEWQRAVTLASGRYQYQTLVWYMDHEAPPLSKCIKVLGFPDGRTFMHFVYRPEIVAAFRELWDVCLKDIDDDYDELPLRAWTRRPTTLRIFYSRTLYSNSEYDKSNPDKTDWSMACHLARFCLKVEKVCNRWLLPPMRGQIPVIMGKVSSEVVAWGGIELARVLRRMQKNGSNKYLDDPDYAAFLGAQ
ncbi:hypothetical protein NQ176_g9201 [Zarea fungicola]|uniref:Uncharacterized protein n=1 Tax=Zarea fungicola TaxID=93591 RepID=A0ACC1MPX1_9HYPO|nr:hypothetical protein NQ176_g9201 [Lecanicillium fungicola]